MQATNLARTNFVSCLSAAEACGGPDDPTLLDAAELAATICGVDCGVICLPATSGWRLAAVVSRSGHPGDIDAALCLRVARGRTPPQPCFSEGVLAGEADDQSLLCMCVFDRQPRELTAAQRDSLRALARQTVSQLSLCRRLEELAAAAAARDASAMHRGLESRFRAFMDHSPAVAFMKDEDGRYVYVNATWTRVFNVPDSRWMGQTDEQLWPPDVASRLREADRVVMAEGQNAAIVETVPLPGGAQSHWQVYKFPFTDPVGRRFLAGIAIDRTEQVEYERRMLEYQSKLEAAVAELQVLATTDGLTQLYNRSAFDSRLLEECERARRGESRLAVLLIDVDHFKPFNDRFGHPAGDEVLRTVAEILRKCSRSADVVARYGGEEFAMILPDTDAAGAAVLGERCRAAVASARWPDRPVTISVGLAAGEGSAAPAELLRLADQALYRSKQGGRNRVTGD